MWLWGIFNPVHQSECSTCASSLYMKENMKHSWRARASSQLTRHVTNKQGATSSRNWVEQGGSKSVAGGCFYFFRCFKQFYGHCFCAPPISLAATCAVKTLFFIYSFVYLFIGKGTITISSTRCPSTLGAWVLICVAALWDSVLRR